MGRVENISTTILHWTNVTLVYSGHVGTEDLHIICVSAGLVGLSLSCLIDGGVRILLVQHFILLWVLPFVISGSSTIPSWPSLPVDPTLSLSGLPPVIISTKEFNQPPLTAPTPSSLVVAEGIPPVFHKLVEKIRKWEYTELSRLLDDYSPPDQMTLFNGQLMVVSSSSQRRWQTAVISHILPWLQAFSIYTAILVSVDATTKE